MQGLHVMPVVYPSRCLRDGVPYVEAAIQTAHTTMRQVQLSAYYTVVLAHRRGKLVTGLMIHADQRSHIASSGQGAFAVFIGVSCPFFCGTIEMQEYAVRSFSIRIN